MSTTGPSNSKAAPAASGVTDATSPQGQRGVRLGVLCGLGAFAWWGLVPIYFKSVSAVQPMEVLAHRVIWSVVLLVILMLAQQQWRSAIALLRSRRTLLTLVVTTALIATNWFIFIWAVANEYILQASLGYFINPLVNVALGFAFLGERLTRWQTASVALAASGVGYLTVAYGSFPWIALVLAFSFGFYGLLRKTAPVGSLVGLTVETALLLPAALGYLIWLTARQEAAFAAGSCQLNLLLPLAGVITAVPLIWFAVAARRLRLATLGFLQYLAPTGHFLLAVLAYKEPFTVEHLISFTCIWTALAVYSLDTVRSSQQR